MIDIAAMESYLKNDLIEAIQKIDANQKPKWGIMTAQHMVEHLGGILVLSTKENDLGVQTPPEKRAAKKHWFFEENNEFIKGVLMPGQDKPQLMPLRFENMAKAKLGFLKAVTKFFSAYAQNPSLEINHPVFGILNYKEWIIFHAKHTKHHLNQFQIIEEKE